MAGSSLRWTSVVIAVVGIAAVVGVAGSAIDAGRAAQEATCTASPTLVEPGGTVTLDASDSTAEIVEFDIDGDGQYERSDDRDFIIEVTYDTVGSYETSVRTESGPSTDTAPCGLVNVTEPPTAVLNLSPQEAVTGESVTFDASESTDPEGAIAEYRWDFNGDGEPDRTTTDPTTGYAYSQAGTYVAEVTVFDEAGASDSATRDVVVEQAPVAACRAEPTTVEPGGTVTIDATGSENGDLIDYDTDGDGEYEVRERTEFTRNTTAGDSAFTPRVRVYQNDPAQGDVAECNTVTVEAANEPPEAALSVSPRPGRVGQPATFNASASTDPDGQITEYRWDFDGNGTVDSTTTQPTTTYTYQQTGSYVPMVTVVDDDGATSTAETDYSVAAPVEAACTVEPTTVEPDGTVTIDATGSENGDLIDYDTDGDGEYEVRERTEFTRNTTAGDSAFTPRVRVYQADPAQGDVAECNTVTVEAANEPPEAALSVSPRPGRVGQPATFNASASTDPDGQITEYRWDFDGNGTVDSTTTQPTTTYTYQQTGSHVPMVTVVDDDGATSTAETDYRVESAPELECRVEPSESAPGEEVQIDASGSGAVDVLDYDTDGDGEYERVEEPGLTITVTYDEAGTYQPQVRDRRSERVADCGSVTIEGNEPPNAAFRPDSRSVAPGEQVTLDASNSTDPDGQIVEYAWDIDDDGTVERRVTTPQIQVNFSATGPKVVSLTVVDDDGATDTTSRDLTVETGGPPVEAGDIPWVPLAAGGGLLGLGGLLYYLVGGAIGGAAGGAGGGGGGSMPNPKPKPTPGSDDEIQYETGVFALPTSSVTISVPIGFEPDLLLFTVLNGARIDPAIDRTAGASFGIAHRTDDEITNQCHTVADDARETDHATCAVADDRVLQIVRHSSANAPGRVSGRVTDTSSSGFDIEVSVPGDDPLAGGIRVLYQAISTNSDVDLEVGFFETPTEPGTQTVDFDVDADHVSLTASAAVSDTDQLWTTNRAVGVSMGNVVETDQAIDQTVWGTSAWPESDHATASVCGIDHSLYLLYQDTDRIAGRTRAAATSVGSTLRLQYDRVYNGPHKLGSTARHPVSYLAMAGDDAMRPAVGAVRFPRAGERLRVDCGFEPAMVELFVTDATVDEEVAGRKFTRPLDVCHGTAIDLGDGLRQYVLHHSVTSEPPAARSDVPDPEERAAADEPPTSGPPGSPAVDSGSAEAGATGETVADSSDGPVADGGRSTGRSTGGSDLPDPASADTGDTTVESESDNGDGRTAPDPKETTDDGRVGLWLRHAADGTIVGRDELHVQELTETGFDVRAECYDTDGRTGAESRPSVVYRAWPSVDGERADESSDGGGDASATGTGKDSDSAPGVDGGTDATGTEGTTNGPNTTADATDTEHNP